MIFTRSVAALAVPDFFVILKEYLNMQVVKFAVHNRAFACWDWELQKKNVEFIKGIDPEYFAYMAEVNTKFLEGEEKHRAALSLRLSYSHGLETLFALLCSTVQAPDCVVGWMLNYKLSDLRIILEQISLNKDFYTRFRTRPVTWEILSQNIHRFPQYDETKRGWIQKGFADLWRFYASEFRDNSFSQEYNAIKHGLRVKAGGFHLAVGREDVPGVPASPGKMVSLGGSDFGSTYFAKEIVNFSDKINFRPRRHNRNWSPECLSHDLVMISMSINNVQSFLSILNGVSPNECKFYNPTSKEAFEEHLKYLVGVNNCSFDLIVRETDISVLSKEDILKSYSENEASKDNQTNAADAKSRAAD